MRQKAMSEESGLNLDSETTGLGVTPFHNANICLSGGSAVGKKIARWGECRTKLPPGIYELACFEARVEKIWHQGKDAWGESPKAILWFEVFFGEYMGSVVPAFLPIRESINQGQKYYEFWVIANGCRRPRRNRLKDMPVSKFIGKVFRGRVVDVKPKYRNGIPKPAIFSYSRADELYELLIGNPDG
jgi:hypothetical protein